MGGETVKKYRRVVGKIIKLPKPREKHCNYADLKNWGAFSEFGTFFEL